MGSHRPWTVTNARSTSRSRRGACTRRSVPRNMQAALHRCPTVDAEERAFTTQCASTVAALAASNRRRHGRRALAVIWKPGQPPWAPPQNTWGAGHLLLLLYRVHTLCEALDRYCYVKLFDADFGSYFNYWGDASWQLNDATELAQYGKAVKVAVRCTADDRKNANFVSRTLHDAVVNAAKSNTAALVKLTVSGWIPFERTGNWTGKLLSSQASESDGAMPASLREMPTGLDRCLCRFVTQPRERMSGGWQPSHTAFHLRTGFADAEDLIVSKLASDDASAAAWAAAACDSAPGDPVLGTAAPRTPPPAQGGAGRQ